MNWCGVRGGSYWARQRRASGNIARHIAVLSIGAALMPVVAVLMLGAVTIRWLNLNRRKDDVDQSEDVVS